jgi:hypothetical protein
VYCLLLSQVVSLAAAGRSNLLGNATVPLPPPEAPQQEQLEASGEQYGQEFKQDPAEDSSAIYPAGESAFGGDAIMGGGGLLAGGDAGHLKSVLFRI